MSGTSGFEVTPSAFITLSTCHDGQLSAPAQSKHTTAFLGSGETMCDGATNIKQLAKVGLGISNGTKKVLGLFLFLDRISRHYVNGQTLAVKEIGNQDETVGVLGKAIRALQSLCPDSKNVVDLDNDFRAFRCSNDI